MKIGTMVLVCMKALQANLIEAEKDCLLDFPI